MNKVVEFPRLRRICQGKEVSLEQVIETAEKNLCVLNNEFTMPQEEGFVVDKARLTEEAWLAVIMIKNVLKDNGLL